MLDSRKGNAMGRWPLIGPEPVDPADAQEALSVCGPGATGC